MQAVNIGFGNIVNADRIIAVISPDSSPVKRIINEAKEKGLLIDASYGRKTRSVIVCDSDHVILSAVAPASISGRFSSSDEIIADDEEDEADE